MNIKAAKEYSIGIYDMDANDKERGKKISERINHECRYNGWEVDKMWMSPRETQMLVLYVRPIELRAT